MRAICTTLAGGLIGLLSLWSSAFAAEFTGYVFGSGGWTGGGYNDPPGVFDYCVIVTQSSDGAYLSIRLFNDESLAIGYENAKLKVPDGAPDAFMLAVDGKAKRKLHATKTGQFLLFELGHDQGFLKALSTGRLLSIETRGRDAVVELLPNTGAMIGELRQCRSYHVQYARVSPSPAPSPPPALAPAPAPPPSPAPPAAPSPSPAPGAGKPIEEKARPPTAPSSPATAAYDYQAVAFPLLVQSGYPNPIVMDMTRQPGDYGDFVLGWLGDGPVGFLGAVASSGEADYHDQFALLLARAALLCGQVGTPAYDPVLTAKSGASIYAGRFDCTEEGVAAVYFASSIIDGQVLVFMHFAREAELKLASKINGRLRQLLRAL